MLCPIVQVKDACYAAGQPAPYLHVALALSGLEGTTKRLAKDGTLANMFRTLMDLSSSQDLLQAAYLLCGQVREQG